MLKCVERVALLIVTVCMPGCSYIVQPAITDIAENVSSAILNQNDPATVRDGAPAYLILLDGLINSNPQSEHLLISGARLYDAYAAVFVEDSNRAQRLTEKSWTYSKRALCLAHENDCQVFEQPFDKYLAFLDTMKRSDVPVLYAFASSWASWIQTHSHDWNARADIPKVEASMLRIVELDENYLKGNPYLYLGVMSIILPPALGGKPELARKNFERAIALSEGKNLMFKTMYANHYARMLFDRDFHDQLLHEVLAADPQQPGLTLMNTIAQQQARDLLKSADEYF